MLGSEESPFDTQLPSKYGVNLRFLGQQPVTAYRLGLELAVDLPNGSRQRRQ